MQNTENKDIQSAFWDNYNKHILPKMELLENDRKHTLKIAYVFCSVCSVVGFCFVFLFLKELFKGHHTDLIFIFLYLIIFTLVFTTFGFCWFRQGFELKIKNLLFPINFNDFELKWNKHNGGILPGNLYRDANLIPYYDDLTYGDGFSGRYKNVSFVIEETSSRKLKKEKDETPQKNIHKKTVNVNIKNNEVELSDSSAKKNEKYTKEIFKGVVISMDMNKNFKGNTIIWPDTMLHKAPVSKLHHTVLEDVEFEKKFDVYTDDDVEARYLITTALMERLNKMQVAFNARKIYTSFYEGKFYIALSTKKDLFYTGSLIKSIKYQEQFTKIFEELSSIILLIEHFKLEERTGL